MGGLIVPFFFKRKKGILPHAHFHRWFAQTNTRQELLLVDDVSEHTDDNYVVYVVTT